MPGRIVFTSPCQPLPDMGGFSCTDQMAFRLTRGQGLFCMYEHSHFSGLHLMAQNLSVPSVVLEHPDLDQLRQELRQGCEWVAISFKLWHMRRLEEMCRMIRREFPQVKVVVGGYGAACASHLLRGPEWSGLVDEVCTGEGVHFMRRLLGEPLDTPLNCRLPKIGSTLPWLNARPLGTIGIILSGLGCRMRCPFCVTSFSTRGRYVEVLDAPGIHRAMMGYAQAGARSVTIYDENFLDQHAKVTELGRLLRRDRKFGLAHHNYFTFGSALAVSQYEPEELLLNGLDTLWIGVESKFAPYAKLAGMDLRETFRSLHEVGIKTVGSMILGDDHQTPGNIQEDVDFFVGLDPTFQQISVLTVIPPLPLWEHMQGLGRIPAGVEWEDYHLYGHTLKYKHFEHPQVLEHVDEAYRRVYHENGPAVMKTLEVNLNGYEHCTRSRRTLLRRDKSRFFRDRVESYRPFLKLGIETAPSDRVRRRLEALADRCRSVLGPPSPEQRLMEDAVLSKARRVLQERNGTPPPPRHEPFRRYTYGTPDERPPGRPYQVTYPAGDPALARQQRAAVGRARPGTA